MLVLSRRLNEKIQIGPDVAITVVEIMPDRVRLGIDAPRDVPVLRNELLRTHPPKEKEHGLERPAP